MDDRSETPNARAAALWLSRRDRGLSAAEQDAYLQWLSEDPARGAEIVNLERAWARLDRLNDWNPAHTVRPNPDLLAPRRRRTWKWASFAAVAAAIAVVAWWSPLTLPATRHAAVVAPGPQRLTLPDGSLVELNRDAQVEVHFTAAERDVTLVRGEAHFIVAKNAARPFVVAAHKLAVRAVGTAFDVQIGPGEVAVLVTEGQVQLSEASNGFALPAGHYLPAVAAGQQAIVSIPANAGGVGQVDVRSLTPVEIERILAWQTMRLVFSDLPLREVVGEFNRYNSRKLLIADPATGDILVGGSFRADNLEPFVRLLDVGFGVSAEPRGNDLVLQRRR